MGIVNALRHALDLSTRERSHESCVLHFLEELSRGEGRKLSLLDLGQASTGSMELYQKFARRIHFEDLNPDELAQKELTDLLPLSSKDTFDVIILWDRLNYLPIQTQQSLYKLLTAHTHSKSLLFLMRERGEERAIKRIFRPENGVLVHKESTTEKAPESLPLSTITSLVKPLTRFRALLRRDGIEELLFIGADLRAEMAAE